MTILENFLKFMEIAETQEELHERGFEMFSIAMMYWKQMSEKFKMLL